MTPNAYISITDDELNLMREAITEESGFALDENNLNEIRSSVIERIRYNRFGTFREYYEFLKIRSNRKLELKELIQQLTVPETCFFRNETHFEVLRKHVLPEIIRKKTKDISRKTNNSSLRILSAGCATGEEPYSLAIMLLEEIGDIDNWEISILGTDINRIYLEKAKKAIYRNKALRNIPKILLDKYFIKNESGYLLKDRVKKMVVFHEHNLKNDAFDHIFAQELDLILCRNVTIYFTIETVKKVIEKFYNLLTDGGYLFIGHSETLWQISDKYEHIEFPSTFVYKKQLMPVPVKVEEKPFSQIPVITRVINIKIEKEHIQKVSPFSKELQDLHKEGLCFLEHKKYEEALDIFNSIIDRDSSFIHAYFSKATILANQAKYKEAIKTLENIITVDNLFKEAYFLMGVLNIKIGDFQRAIDEFKKTVYVDQNFILSYFNMANIYLYLGEIENAKREYKNTIKLLEVRSKEETIECSEGMSCDVLLMACKRNLARASYKR
ncbi:CheR family methyltransferase [Candidatus Omnitrophota bacterium]